MKDFDPNRNKFNKIHDAMFKTLGLGFVGFAFALCIFTFFDSKGLVNYTVAFSLPLVVECIVHACIIYFTCYLSVSSIIVYLILQFYGFFMILFYTIELRLGCNKYRSNVSLRQNPENLRKEYRAVQICVDISWLYLDHI